MDAESFVFYSRSALRILQFASLLFRRWAQRSPSSSLHRRKRVNIILIGAQGSGKGTQAERLAQNLGIHHVSSGDLFRKAADEGTELGRKARLYLDRGELVPDDLTVSMILHYIADTGYIRDGVLLDGFPRTIAQAQALDEGLLSADKCINCTVYLKVPREVLLERLSGRY